MPPEPPVPPEPPGRPDDPATGARVPLVPPGEWAEGTRAALTAHLRRPDLYLGDDPRPMPNVFGLLAHHPRLGEAWLAFNATLAAEAKVDLRLRELIILRVAWRTRSAYEWSQHVRIARDAGLTPEQVRAVRDGPASGGWPPLERAVLAAADDVVDHHRVGDATWAALRAHLDEPELLEVLFVAGTYLCFAVVTNGAGLAADPVLDPVEVPPFPDDVPAGPHEEGTP